MRETIADEIRSEKSLKLDVTSISSTRRIKSDLFILVAQLSLCRIQLAIVCICHLVVVAVVGALLFYVISFFLIFIDCKHVSGMCVCDITTEASVCLLMVWHHRLVCRLLVSLRCKHCAILRSSRHQVPN